MAEEQIINELKENLGEEYKEIKPLGKSGGTGQIFLTEYVPERTFGKFPAKQRIIKVLKFEKADDSEIKKLFEKEMETLDNLDYPSFPKVYKRGSIKLYDAEMPFYISDYFDKGTALDYLDSINDSLRRFKVVKGFLIQVLHALDYLHRQNYFHLDLKNLNLLVTELTKNHPQIKIIDFGALECTKAGSKERRVISTRENWPEEFKSRFKPDASNPARAPIILNVDEIEAYLDLHMLGVAFKELFGRVGEIPREYLYEFRYFNILISRFFYSSDRKEDLIPSALEGIKAINKWDDSWKQTAFLIDGYLRIPGLGLRHFSSQVRELVDTRLFQRLRKIRQLGLVYFVFPGGSHSRFEHSLGVFENSLNYIAALCTNGNAPLFLQNLTKTQISYTAIYALLHDACHYPFSHIIDEVIPSEDHESLLIRFLNSDDSLFHSLPEAEVYFKELESVLEKSWDIPEIQNILPHMKFFSDRELNVPDIIPKDERAIWRVLRDIVNGPIDADKLDYLQRDGHHCGVPYAMGIDRERLFASLSVEKSKGRIPKLIVTYKGRVCAEMIAVSRYMLFSEVYWGHAVRSFTAMLKSCIEKLLESKLKDREIWLFKELGLFSKGDDEALSTIIARLGDFRPAVGLSKRQPFSRLLVLSPLVNREENAYKLISDARGDDRKPKARWFEFRRALIDRIAKDIFNGNAKSDDILIDVPDPGKYNIEELTVASELDIEEMHEIGPLWTSVRENFTKSARKIRIFINPVFRPAHGPERKELARKVMDLITK